MHPRRAEAARTGMHAGSHRAVCARARVRGAHGAARGTGGGRGDVTLRWLASYLTVLQSITAVAARRAAAQMSPLRAERPILERAAAAGIRRPHGTPPVGAGALCAA